MSCPTTNSPTQISIANSSIETSLEWGIYRDERAICVANIGTGATFDNNGLGDISPVPWSVSE